MPPKLPMKLQSSWIEEGYEDYTCKKLLTSSESLARKANEMDKFVVVDDVKYSVPNNN